MLDEEVVVNIKLEQLRYKLPNITSYQDYVDLCDDPKLFQFFGKEAAEQIYHPERKTITIDYPDENSWHITDNNPDFPGTNWIDGEFFNAAAEAVAAMYVDPYRRSYHQFTTE